jgi:hypothetical protein
VALLGGGRNGMLDLGHEEYLLLEFKCRKNPSSGALARRLEGRSRSLGKN